MTKHTNKEKVQRLTVIPPAAVKKYIAGGMEKRTGYTIKQLTVYRGKKSSRVNEKKNYTMSFQNSTFDQHQEKCLSFGLSGTCTPSGQSHPVHVCIYIFS